MNSDEKEVLKKVVERLQWYVNEDDTYEGGKWDEINDPWIRGKNEAISVLEEANKFLTE